MSPRVLLIGSLAFSLLFNVVWAATSASPTPQGFLSVAAAAVCTLIVPAGLHLWPHVPANSWPTSVLRAVVMSGICVAAAITSFSHSVAVLHSAGWSDWTAWSVTGGAELLVALSTMAVDSGRRAVPDVVSDPDSSAGRSPSTGADRHPDTAADSPAGDTADVPVQGDGGRHALEDRPRRALSVADPDRDARFREWVTTLSERPTEYAVRKQLGCRQSVAQRLLAELDRDDELAQAVSS